MGNTASDYSPLAPPNTPSQMTLEQYDDIAGTFMLDEQVTDDRLIDAHSVISAPSVPSVQPIVANKFKYIIMTNNSIIYVNNTKSVDLYIKSSIAKNYKHDPIYRDIEIQEDNRGHTDSDIKAKIIKIIIIQEIQDFLFYKHASILEQYTVWKIPFFLN
jgi:hypothetical protein